MSAFARFCFLAIVLVFDISCVFNARIESLTQGFSSESNVNNHFFISINDITVIENAGVAALTISLSKASTQTLTLDWATENGTAISGVNFTANSGTITFEAGSTTASIVIAITDTPSLCEGDRVFYVNLSNSSIATIQDSQGIVTIQENDYPTLSIGADTNYEGLILAPMVTLSQACGQDITVEYTSTDNTAMAGLDYFGVSNMSLTIPAGSTSRAAPITTFNDNIVESTENLVVTISNPNHGVITSASAVVTILDNDVLRTAANNFTQVSVSGYHVCALTTGGQIKCWGQNLYGQLGIGGTAKTVETPGTVSGLGAVATKVSAGGTRAWPGFTCAVVDGGAKCWGDNGAGQLGTGNTTSASSPASVVGLSSGVTDIATGGLFGCAVVSGGAKCWGNNAYGQLGNSSTVTSYVPVDVTGLNSGVASISAGEFSACAVLTNGTIKCWGYNGSGQLGDGTTTNSSSPTSVTSILSGATKVEISIHHACAIVSGGVKCWGDNTYGELGDGTTVSKLSPTDVLGLTSGIVDIQVSSDDRSGVPNSCAVKSSGDVYCWGNNGLYAAASCWRKFFKPNTDRWNIIWCHSSFNRNNHGLRHCEWGSQMLGRDDFGSFARPGHQNNGFPNDTFLPANLSQFSMSGYGTNCVVIAGAAKCWGSGGYWAIGDGLGVDSAVLKDVVGLSSNVVKVVVNGQNGDGASHACAIKSDGSLYCWGANNYGQIGDGTGGNRTTPVLVISSGVVDVAVAYGNHTCAILTGGELKCWGRNTYGQLGNGSTTDSSFPVSVTGLSSGVTQVVASRSHTCAIVNGGMKCWGSNVAGELGLGSTSVPVLTATDVPGLTSQVTSITATGYYGANKSCAVVNGALKCWGSGYLGTLGDGTGLDRYSPTNVVGMNSGIKKVKLSEFTGCALTNVGALKCWGLNSNGQVGTGAATQNYNSPVSVVGMQTGVLDFDVGYLSVCSQVVGGYVKCWGSNYAGSLGYGYFIYTDAAPVDILFP